MSDKTVKPTCKGCGKEGYVFHNGMCHPCGKAVIAPFEKQFYDDEKVRCPACGKVQGGRRENLADFIDGLWEGYEHSCPCGETFGVDVEVDVTYVSPKMRKK